MDVLSDKKVTRLVAAQGKTRVYEMEDLTWMTARDGTVAWRNNNPGNLKFEFKGSADHTVQTERTKEKALAQAQGKYNGIVDLDQWGNAIFESYEAGREAQKKLIHERFSESTVEELVKGYSKADYSGATHHANQAAVIYATAEAEGFDLHGKKVKDMTLEEVNALADGVARAEYWKAGTTRQTPPLTDDQLREALHSRPQVAFDHPLPAHTHARRQGDRGEAVGYLQEDLAVLGFTARDGNPISTDRHFGPRTREAVEAFQQAHGFHADGVAGPATLAAIANAKAHAQAPVSDFLDARHPAHGIYEQAFSCVARIDEAQGRSPGPHTQRLAGSLTSAAVAAGFNRIDHVVLSDDASRSFAVQGDLKSPFKQYTEVDVMQAIRTPLSQSSLEAATYMRAAAQPQAQQVQQPVPEPVQQQSPSMVR
ncbi:peptidoglycan-binding domain-containing protein [Frateuria defendens]|uniref:peptidoglycan-binding domain-containing protein n=1 Tax=Frateuria defendens TaxID=2219559 RepID=UPI00066FC9CB|nr:peptidoglycan-binding protein [Frateuria defendens]